MQRELRYLSLFLLLAASVASAAAGEEVRGVEWYRQHPTERAAVTRRCVDNPGQLERTADCINAERASLAAKADAMAGTGSGLGRTPARRGGGLESTSPEVLAANPEARRMILGLCARMTAEQQAAYGLCEPARRSLGPARRT
ncbi:EexN family lipoprotein [Belnapia rosea]|uniref:Uncharacterized protein n=1 Tax=Belnapia rosea TaxID=938405 RepID=A0A1G7BX94_9PROT|nr:EexN family lipoprotein [Belnapia rosea]SDE31026.1 hypothetical protein SAMN04487779_102740 [Belnapia rosea]